MTEFCSDGGEPLAGTAPIEDRLLVVEAPGRWAAKPLADCSLPEAARRSLATLDPRWRVLLARRPDRPLRRQQDRRIWVSEPDGTVRHWRVALDAPVRPEELPGTGDPITSPLLLVCTHGRRDRCCALRGRAILDQLDSPSVWECSHLGGHRFAPTALRLPDRLLFGRLDAATAPAILAGKTPNQTVRGPLGWPPAVQTAAVAVWRKHCYSALASAQQRADQVALTLRDGTAWRVEVQLAELAPRLTSCGGQPEAGQVWRAGLVHAQ